MKRVYKYEIRVADFFDLEMPVGAELLRVDAQGNVPCLWAIVDPDARTEVRHFRLAGTGHPIDEPILTYVGTVLLSGGALVFHLFEVAP